MKAIQVFYEPHQDPWAVAEQIRLSYPEPDRYRFNLIVSPACMRPPGRGAVSDKQISHQGKLFQDEKNY